MKVIDLRSDTVTKPTSAMRAAIARAEVGDDVYGEDPTINRLEALAAKMLGTEAALFVTSGTQSNLLALLTHCQRGDEYIVGQNAHTYKYEGGGAAIIGSIQPQPLEFEKDGTIDLERVAQAIKPDDPHFARTRLLCLENTHWGRVIPLSYLTDSILTARASLTRR
jgi:threonine aldolase